MFSRIHRLLPTAPQLLAIALSFAAAALIAVEGQKVADTEEPADQFLRFGRALIVGETETVRAMLEEGFQPESSYDQEILILPGAVVAMHTEALALLAPGRVNGRDKDGLTPLMIAARISYTEGVSELIDQGADPNSRDHYGRNALHLAAEGGDLGTISRLLAAGTDPDAADWRGRRPADVARDAKQCLAEQYLLARENPLRRERQKERCELEVIDPSICTGADPETILGSHSPSAMRLVCPPGSAIYSLDDPSRRSGKYTVRAVCCSLPAPDMLKSDIRVIRKQRCPDGMLMVGMHDVESRTARTLVQCSPINRNRYLLGPPSPGVGWGMGNEWDTAQYRTDEIPRAVRWSVGRMAMDNWDVDGCIGNPVGAALVGIPNPSCESASFRQVQYSGLPGDPPRETPVQMYPDCARTPDPFSTARSCDGPLRSWDQPDDSPRTGSRGPHESLIDTRPGRTGQ